MAAGEYMPVTDASVKIMTRDSVYVSGTKSDEKGRFTLLLSAKGDYRLNVSFLGCKPLERSFSVRGRTTDMGVLLLEEDSIMLEGTVVTGNIPKVQMVGDTLMYNAGAFNVEEGSVLDELLERLPGAVVTEDGITINGKTIRKILLDGKEFFIGDMNTARKNIPVEIVDKLKVYDEKSEMARVTGIDDGVENVVVDVKIKKGMNIGYMVNANAGVGSHSRYAERINISAYNPKNRLSVVGNTGNVGRGRSGGSQGLRTNYTAGVNYNYNDMKRSGRQRKGLLMDGSVQWRNSRSDRQTTTMNENWEKVGARTYSNAMSKNLSKNGSWNADYHIEWRPDTLTNIQLRPSWSYSTSDGLNSSESMQFSDDPYRHSESPLSLYQNFDDADGIRTNRRTTGGISYSENRRVGGSLQYNRRFGNMGRNINFRVEGSYNRQKSQSLSRNMVHLYKVKDSAGNDSVFYNNRYNVNPNNRYSYSFNVSYSEPIMRATFLQFNYVFSYSSNETNRSTYRLDALGGSFGDGAELRYRGFDDYLSRVGGQLEDYIDTSLSKFGNYTNANHDVQLLFRMIREHYNFSVGMRWLPQRSHFVQEWHGVHSDTTRTVVNFNPTLNLHIRFNRRHTLRIAYRGSSSQPDINDLLDITDDSNPLNITRGNPGLKPSFTNNLSVEWTNYLEMTNTSLNARWHFAQTSNSVSRMVTYDDATGGRLSQPQNINGNWNTDGNLNINTSLDEAKNWNVNASTALSYSNRVSYITVDRTSSSRENVTRNTTWRQNLGGSYRNEWLEIEIRGDVDYNHVRNMLMSSSNRDTWHFAYGGSVNVRLPWQMTINTSLRQTSYRGYTDASANTNEMLWNASVSQSLMKRRQLVLRLQVYDILGQKRNFSYNVGDTRLSESHYNSINQYAMLTAVFNFRSFGGRAARGARRGDRGRRGEMFDSDADPRPFGGVRGGGRSSGRREM